MGVYDKECEHKLTVFFKLKKNKELTYLQSTLYDIYS